jgi:hypothetical protein
LSTHLLLALPSGLYPFGFTTNILHAFFFSPIRATCPEHLILLDFNYRGITLLNTGYKIFFSAPSECLQAWVKKIEDNYQCGFRMQINNRSDTVNETDSGKTLEYGVHI